MTVSPPDAVVAARSFPRRWRALFARAAGDDDATDVLVRSGAPTLALRAARALRSATEQLHGRPPAPVDDPLEAIDAEANHLAGTIEAFDTGQWDKALVGAVSDAVDEAAALLREAERAIERARERSR